RDDRRLSPAEYPAAGAGSPAELVLHRAQRAGRHPVAGLKLPEGAVGHAGRREERAAVAHAERGAPGDHVVTEPLPVLIPHEHILKEEVGRIQRTDIYLIGPYRIK